MTCPLRLLFIGVATLAAACGPPPCVSETRTAMQALGASASRSFDELAKLGTTLEDMAEPLALIGGLGPALDEFAALKSLEVDVPLVGTLRPWERLTSTFEALKNIEQGLTSFVEISRLARRLQERVTPISTSVKGLPARWQRGLDGGPEDIRALSQDLDTVLAAYDDLNRVLRTTAGLVTSLADPLKAARTAIRAAKKLPYLGQHVAPAETLLMAAETALASTLSHAVTGFISAQLGDLEPLKQVARAGARCGAR